MKKIILFSFMFTLCFLGYTQGSFNDGFYAGYKEGYCYNSSSSCVSISPPNAPISPAGKNSYKDGYNIGFTRGKADAGSNNSLKSPSLPNANSNNSYNKYRDANKYQSGGKAESEMIDKAIEEGRKDGEMLGNAIYMMRMNKHKSKLSENTVLYEIDPSIELAFEIANSAKQLLSAGMYDNRFGPISKKHKILIAKYKGRYKKYLNAVKKGKEKPE